MTHVTKLPKGKNLNLKDINTVQDVKKLKSDPVQKAQLDEFAKHFNSQSLPQDLIPLTKENLAKMRKFFQDQKRILETQKNLRGANYIGKNGKWAK